MGFEEVFIGKNEHFIRNGYQKYYLKRRKIQIFMSSDGRPTLNCSQSGAGNIVLCQQMTVLHFFQESYSHILKNRQFCRV